MNHKWIKWMLLITTFIVIYYPRSHPKDIPQKPSIQVNTNISYGASIDQRFDSYIPQNKNNTLMIFIHGGSWSGGGKYQFTQVSIHYASTGYSVINMDYRLSPSWKFDAPLKDIETVIKIVEQNPSNYGLNPGYKLVLIGYSSGAHLASLFSLMEAEYTTRQVNVCIGLAGIYDLTRILNGSDGPLLVASVKSFLGNASSQLASPLYQIKVNEPTKFLLIWGQQDDVVSRQQIDTFYQKLKENNLQVDLLIPTDKNHQTIFNSIPMEDEIDQSIINFIN